MIYNGGKPPLMRYSPSGLMIYYCYAINKKATLTGCFFGDDTQVFAVSEYSYALRLANKLADLRAGM